MATAVRRKRSLSRSSSSSSGDSSREDRDERRMKSVLVKRPLPREATPPPKRKKEEDPLLTRTGGAYIPPARLRMMQEAITDKSSAPYQRLTWEALKKSINGLVNKVNVSNISNIVRELFQENLVRGKGLFARSVIQAQGASPMFSHVYAGLVAIINTKLPRVGELIITRLLVRFKRSFSRKDKAVCISTVKFLAHLVNQHVLYELVALELLTLLLDEPTDDSVEVAVGFIKDCGLSLKTMNSQALHTIFETFRSILHSGKLTSRVQYMIEVLFAVRKDNFKDHPSVIKELDLVHEDDQHTHFVSLLEGDFNTEDRLNVFQADPNYLENEEAYKSIKEEVLGEESEGSGSEEEGSEESEDSEDEDEEDESKLEISDQTGTSELVLRRQIYLTIMSSLDFEECAHKLLKTMKEGQEGEIAFMLVECCSQERSYMRFYGMLGQRLCLLNQAWVAVFNEAFLNQYTTVHRLETNKLRNVAKFFSQLFYMDALPWTSMACIHLNEEETNSSSRIFVKIVFQQLAEFMGMIKLNDRLRDPMLSESFEGLLPRDNPKNTRFAINFFTSIGLGGLTDDLREHLKNTQKMIMAQKQVVSSDSSSSSSSSSDSSESESESSSSSEEEQRRRKRSRKQKKVEGTSKSEDRGRREGNKEHEENRKQGSRHDEDSRRSEDSKRSDERRYEDGKRNEDRRHEEGRRDEGRRHEESKRNEDRRHEEGRRDEGRRHEESKRNGERRYEEAKRNEGRRHEEGKRNEERMHEEGRRDERRHEESKRRHDDGKRRHEEGRDEEKRRHEENRRSEDTKRQEERKRHESSKRNEEGRRHKERHEEYSRKKEDRRREERRN